MSKPPLFSARHSLCVICEGYEEEIYVRQLLSKDVWSSIYAFTIINAKGEGNIPARYQFEINKDAYELVLVFCDTDRSPYQQYQEVKDKINVMHEADNAVGKIVIYANPCSMQIILLHFAVVSLKTQGKKTNAKRIEELTGVKGYKANQEEHIKAICAKINRQSYFEMKQRVADINRPDDVPGSTNFSKFLQCFESENPQWIIDIRNSLISTDR
jgi:hypothetical protein